MEWLPASLKSWFASFKLHNRSRLVSVWAAIRKSFLFLFFLQVVLQGAGHRGIIL